MATKKKKQLTKKKQSTKKLSFGKMSPLKMLVAVLVVGAIAGLGIYMLNKGKAASTGFSHTCAIKTDETLWCWGLNNYGELGEGGNGSSYVPIQANITGVTSVSSGSSHTCAGKKDGTVWCWGQSFNGKLGIGNGQQNKQLFLEPQKARISGVASVSGGSHHTCAIKTDATLWCWGEKSNGQLGIGKTKGGNIYGEGVPTQVNIAGVTSLTGGYNHTCATKTDRTLWCWGSNNAGQVGIGNTTDQYVPMQVNIAGVTSVSAGGVFDNTFTGNTCATKTDGTVWCWGRNNLGQLGTGNTTNSSIPMQVNISGVKSVTAGGTHTCATKTDGTLWCWGNNSYGGLGTGNTIDSYIPMQVNIAGVASVTANFDHTCATKTDGTLWCWGRNYAGVLGIGNTTNSSIPMQVNITGVKP